MARFVWMEEETGMFLSIIRDFKNKPLSLLHPNQKRNAAVYQEERDFQEP